MPAKPNKNEMRFAHMVSPYTCTTQSTVERFLDSLIHLELEDPRPEIRKGLFDVLKLLDYSGCDFYDLLPLYIQMDNWREAELLILLSYETEIDDYNFVTRLSAVDPFDIGQQAKVDFTTDKRRPRYVRVLRKKYNEHRGGKKLRYRFKD